MMSKLEEKLFCLLTELFPETTFTREYRFDQKGTGEFLKNGLPKYHKWRFDIANVGAKIAFEVEGGIWIPRSGHTHPISYTKDCIKYNAATAQGWKVFRLTSTMINLEYLSELLIE